MKTFSHKQYAVFSNDKAKRHSRYPMPISLQSGILYSKGTPLVGTIGIRSSASVRYRHKFVLSIVPTDKPPIFSLLMAQQAVWPLRSLT